MENFLNSYWVELSLGAGAFLAAAGYVAFKSKINDFAFNLGKAIGSVLRRKGLDDEAAEVGQKIIDGIKTNSKE